MFRIKNLFTHLGMAALGVLAACGGGGGSDAPGSTGSTGSTGGTGTSTDSGNVAQSGLVINTDKQSLGLVSIGNSSTPETTITFALSGAQSGGTYYAKAEPDGKAPLETYIVDSTLTSITVGIRSGSWDLPNVDGAVLFKLCSDEQCRNVAWSRSIPYHVRKYSIDTADVALNGFEGATISATRAITPRPVAGDLVARVYDGAKWLQGSIDAEGRLLVSGSGADLPKGNYSSAIYVVPVGEKYSAGIPVSVAMSLGTGVILPADGALTIDAATPSQVAGEMALAFNGGQAPNWSVSSDKAWLVPMATAGMGAATVRYNIDVAKLAGLANFTSETAQLTFRIAGQPDAVHRVAVGKKLPEILALSAAQVPAGQPVQLRLRGRGLQQLGTIGAITLNGQALTQGTIVSDTEATVTLGGMASGSYAFGTPGGAGGTQRVLSVVDAPRLESAVIASEGTKSGLVYSAVRSAMYTVDHTHAKLLRYRLVNGTWTNDRSMPVPAGSRIALSLDEKILYTTDGIATLEERDPDTLAVTTSTMYKGREINMSTYLTNGTLPITNDGRIWFAYSSYPIYFDTVSRTFVEARMPDSLSMQGLTYVVSRDGSRMLVYDAVGTYDNGVRYDSGTGKFDRPANTPFFSNVGAEVSGDGKYVLSGATNYYETDSYRFVGLMPSGTGGYYQPTLVSHDGSRIYSTVTKYESGILSLVRIDIIAAPAMTKIGEIPLPAGVANCTDNTGCSFRGIFTLAPFGDAIIWAGNKGIAVLPIPKPLGAVSGARFRLLK